MKTVQHIYDAFRIMPSLQLHQLRVAAVGKTICDNLTRDIDTKTVVLACLFHDMGNIIKSDLDVFPDFVEPEGRAHWQMVKNDFLSKYGTSEHDATAAIMQEIGLSADILAVVGGIGFSKLQNVHSDLSFELKIVQYGDLRVGPHGVISMTARMEEGRGRYKSKHPTAPRDEDTWEKLIAEAYELEKQVFAEADIAPEDITEQSIQPLIAELRGYEVV